MVKQGTFRGDLYYRLKVIPVLLPPLRERREDVPLLAQHFLNRVLRSKGATRSVSFTQDAMRQLMSYAWPGNVRQLENVVERAVALSPTSNEIEGSALPDEIRFASDGQPEWNVPLPEDGLNLEASVSLIERRLIMQALKRTGGNKRRAADLLRVKRTTLVEKLKRLNRLPKAVGGDEDVDVGEDF